MVTKPLQLLKLLLKIRCSNHRKSHFRGSSFQKSQGHFLRIPFMARPSSFDYAPPPPLLIERSCGFVFQLLYQIKRLKSTKYKKLSYQEDVQKDLYKLHFHFTCNKITEYIIQLLRYSIQCDPRY